MTSKQNIKHLLDGDDVDYGEILRQMSGVRTSVFTRPIDEPADASPVIEASAPRRMTRKERLVESDDRRERIVRFIERYFSTHFRPPTIREIGEGADIGSTSMVSFHMKALVKARRVLDTGEHGENRRYVPSWLPDAVRREMRRRGGDA